MGHSAKLLSLVLTLPQYILRSQLFIPLTLVGHGQPAFVSYPQDFPHFELLTLVCDFISYTILLADFNFNRFFFIRALLFIL